MDANGLFSLHVNDGGRKDDMEYSPSNVESASQFTSRGELTVGGAQGVQELSESMVGGRCSVRGLDHADVVFDLPKIVNSVKMKVRETRQKRRMLQEKVSFLKVPEKDTLNLQTLFDEASVSSEEKRSEKISSDVEDFGLGVLPVFEKTEQKGKRGRKKTRKMKRATAKKIIENESFGLELLFNEESKVNENKRRARKRNKYEMIQDPEKNIVSDLDESKVTGKTTVKCKRPNHFVAIRVSNPEIQSVVENFQASLLQEDPNLKPALIPLPSLHLTMAVMHLDKAMTVVAKSALQKCKVKISQILDTVHFKLKFVGIGNFRNEVVFAKIEEKHLECLKSINDVITAAFEDEGICTSDKKGWKPHLTLLKLSRKRSLRKKGIRKVNEDSYTSWNDSYFGEEVVKNVHLCSMFETKEQDGFYKCIETISLTKIDEEQVGEPQEIVPKPTIGQEPKASCSTDSQC